MKNVTIILGDGHKNECEGTICVAATDVGGLLNRESDVLEFPLPGIVIHQCERLP
jgi:hypothetical protein